MKRLTIVFCLMCLVGLSGCKEKDWIDWKVQNVAWLEQNSKQEGVITTPTGLQYKVIRQGYAGSVKPDAKKTVVMDYVGTLVNGDIFDSGASSSMAMSGLIKGFAEGLSKMNISGHYILYIPYELAYKDEGKGSKGDKAFVPPYSTLIFDVTLLDVY